MKNLAIIPARGGSKRIPGKNIKDFLGKPIIAYSIIGAIESGVFDEIMVSTDDLEIANIAKEFGAKVPFMRSEVNSNDYASTQDAINEVIENYKKQNLVFDNICCIYATAPFVTTEKLIEAYTNLQNPDIQTVFPIVSFGYPIQRSLKTNGDVVNMFWPENFNKRSQDCEKAFHDAGMFYWFKRSFFEKKLTNIFDNSGYVVYKENEVQDIDNLTDWKIAELKYKALNF